VARASRDSPEGPAPRLHDRHATRAGSIETRRRAHRTRRGAAGGQYRDHGGGARRIGGAAAERDQLGRALAQAKSDNVALRAVADQVASRLDRAIDQLRLLLGR